MKLTSTMLIYATTTEQKRGSVKFFSLRDWALLEGCELRHDNPVRAISPNPSGTRVVVTDSLGRGNASTVPQTRALIDVPDFGASSGGTASGSFGMPQTAECLSLWRAASFATYIYSPTSVSGASIQKIGRMESDESGGFSMPSPTLTKMDWCLGCCCTQWARHVPAAKWKP